jgi:hypothetical protein
MLIEFYPKCLAFCARNRMPTCNYETLGPVQNTGEKSISGFFHVKLKLLCDSCEILGFKTTFSLF